MGETEDEVVGWHHQLNAHEFEQTLGDRKGQGGLACCSAWGPKESDTTEELNRLRLSEGETTVDVTELVRGGSGFEPRNMDAQPSPRLPRKGLGSHLLPIPWATVCGSVKASAWEPADPGLQATKESLVGWGLKLRRVT